MPKSDTASSVEGSSWETVSYGKDPLKASLVERARKRTASPKRDPYWWTVSGHAGLGDSYDFYDVHLRDNGTYYCSCSANQGGEYRRNTCSHRTAVILWRQEHDDPWEGESEWEADGDADDADAPDSDLPDGLSDGSEGEDLGSSVYEAEQPAGDDGESSVRGSAGGAQESPAGSNSSNAAHPDSGLTQEPDALDGEGAEGLASGDNTDPSGLPNLAFDPWELDEDDPPVPQDIARYWGGKATPTIPALPDKFEAFRYSQWKGIIELIEALDDGVKCVFLSAPTGSGKSLAAAATPQILGKSFIYTATTHVLQDQVEREFTYAKVLKGRRNYPTYDHPNDPDLTAEDCTAEKATLPACVSCPGWTQGSSWGEYDDERGTNEAVHCANCHPVSSCPYRVAKRAASMAHMAVLNTAYFLTETSLGNRSVFKGADLVFIDEADMLEEELMNSITVEISPRMRKDLGVGLPKVTVESAWVDWIRDEVVPAIKARIKALPPASTNLFGKPDVKVLRAKKRYESLLQDVNLLLKPAPPARGEEPDPDAPPALMAGWVLTGFNAEDRKKDAEVTVTFKPITVRDYAWDHLWSRAEQFVLMSATIISPEQMAYDLGLEDDEWAVVEIPSSFDKTRRPVVARGRIEVNKKTMDSGAAYPVLVDDLIAVLDAHPNERVLVHSNSYKLTRELFYETRKISPEARSRLYTYFYAHERNKALENYLADSRGVLIAPSFERGVDLHGDDCRVVVIAKIPFPYLGDAQVKARLYGTGRSGRIWYTVQTIRTICQMTGRGMRSESDWAISYILDDSFTRIYYDNQKLFPAWWREALVLDETDPKWREPLRILRAGELS